MAKDGKEAPFYERPSSNNAMKNHNYLHKIMEMRATRRANKEKTP
jgi:hypothetical protein